MIMHVAVFTWRESTTSEEIAGVEAALSRMPALIPALKEYHFGSNLGLRPGTADFAREVISPLLATRTAIQVEHADRVSGA
jgi:hypothetical protein